MRQIRRSWDWNITCVRKAMVFQIILVVIFRWSLSRAPRRKFLTQTGLPDATSSQPSPPTTFDSLGTVSWSVVFSMVYSTPNSGRVCLDKDIVHVYHGIRGICHIDLTGYHGLVAFTSFVGSIPMDILCKNRRKLTSIGNSSAKDRSGAQA